MNVAGSDALTSSNNLLRPQSGFAMTFKDEISFPIDGREILFWVDNRQVLTSHIHRCVRGHPLKHNDLAELSLDDNVKVIGLTKK